MLVADFDFDLPDELIAQDPPERRGSSRLLVLHRESGAIEHTVFTNLADFLHTGDLLVVNDTRVFPARLRGQRVPTGGAVECLLLRQIAEASSSDQDRAFAASAAPRGPDQTPPLAAESRTGFADHGTAAAAEDPRYHGVWEALMHPGQKLKPGARVVFEGDGVRLHGEVVARHFHGRRTIRLWSERPIEIAAAIDRVGHVPLPPYIKRDDRAADRERYQTVFAAARGSVAAPTAGLHFTDELVACLASRGIERTQITLHVGYGTFKPVRAERVEEHTVDAEQYIVSPDAAGALTRALGDRRRVVAAGTTTTRALESLSSRGGVVHPERGETTLFIHPGHRFRIVSGLITNFHLPRSSLLMLVCAFAGREAVLAAYREAVRRRYRFYSYGDAMLIL